MAENTTNEIQETALELADEYAKIIIESDCHPAIKRRGEGWWYHSTDVQEGGQKEVNKAIRYLAARGKLEVHNLDKNLVRPNI